MNAREPAAEDRSPLLYGRNPLAGLVAVELVESDALPDRMALLVRRDGGWEAVEDVFRPFIVVTGAALEGCPVPFERRQLMGGGPLDLLATFRSWRECLQAQRWLAEKTVCQPGDPLAPYFFLNDPVQQYLTLVGSTFFTGMQFEDLHRMQMVVKCYTSEGFEFCNAAREADRIVVLGLGDQTGWSEVLEGEEQSIIEKCVQLVRERDPDVIEGHDLCNFHLAYLAARARRHGVRLTLGRNGSEPRRRSGRYSVGERTIAYDRFEIWGRHVVDTLLLAHAYDVSHRSLEGFSLREVAECLGVGRPKRVVLDPAGVNEAFRQNPERLRQEVQEELAEVRELAGLLARSNFVQAQMLPFSYQSVCTRGTAAKIDALMIREYLARGHALPMPHTAREFAGAYTDVFVRGVVRNVHHCDVRSLYPSLMLTQKLAPASDELGIFLQLLSQLREYRVAAKLRARKSATLAERAHYEAVQSAFKVLINSFYGYLGFPQARFSDFDVAEKVTAEGRRLLKAMSEWLQRHGATPVEMDTDGIYFVPPGFKDAQEIAEFRREFAASLPPGIEVEFDGEYQAMFSYKMKNYALLTDDGQLILRGGALKSRNLEPFQRAFVNDLLRLFLEGRESEASELKARYVKALTEHQWPITWLAKTEILQDAPSTYQGKVRKRARGRSAAYELALRSGRDYKPGDQISYYVTGNKKNVSVHENAKLVTEWDPKQRDENVPYYLAKLEALFEKLMNLTRENQDATAAEDMELKL
ncbi:MAG: DNA polymerase domain-containing protein [Kiritimatiellia bacterium]